jgi:hypothetical protein
MMMMMMMMMQIIITPHYDVKNFYVCEYLYMDRSIELFDFFFLDHAIIFAFAEGDGRKKKKKKDRTQ